MALTLELTPAQEARLLERASQAGYSSPTSYVASLLEDSPERTNEPAAAADQERPQTGAELLATLRRKGLLRGYGDPDVDSVTLARRLRDEMQNRYTTFEYHDE